MPSIVERFRDRFSPETDVSPAAEKPAWAITCLNCGAPLTSAFCPDCGQRAVPPHPTLGELAGDAFAELTGWDGKFIETFRLLLLKPGELTRQFIEGKRVRFIAAVRLYLTLSLVYFVTAGSTPVLRPVSVGIDADPVKIGVTSDKPKPTAADKAGKAALDAQAGLLTDADKQEALKSLAKAPPIIKPILGRIINDPAGFKRNLYENMPRVMFVLVPIFGMVVGMFYRGRQYPLHLYFAIHLASYVCLVMTVAELCKFTHVFTFYAVVAGIAQVSIPIYMFLALRRVYGGSIGLTVAKELGIGVVYLAAYSAAMFAVVYYAAMTK
jgi:hypothetical protein